MYLNSLIIASYLYRLCSSHDPVNVRVPFYCVRISWSASTALTCSWFSSVVTLSSSNATLHRVSHLYSMFFAYRGWGTYEKPLMMLYSCSILPPWSWACCFTLGPCLSACCANVRLVRGSSTRKWSTYAATWSSVASSLQVIYCPVSYHCPWG